MSRDRDEYPDDEREQDQEYRRIKAYSRHWCDTCHGHTGPGSPCNTDPEPDPEPEPDEEES